MRSFVSKSDGYYAPPKDPGSILDYTLNYSKRLASDNINWQPGDDTIVNSTWTVPTGITNYQAGWDTLKAFIWLSGGTAGVTYTITNRITTAAGRIIEQSFKLQCLDQ